MIVRLLGGLVLVAIFLLLLPEPKPLDIVLAIVVAAVAMAAVGPSPLEGGTGRRSPVAFVRLFLWVAVDTLRGTARVAAAVLGLRPPRRPGAVVIEVEPCSEEALVLTGVLMTISPGSILLRADADRGELEIHVVDGDDPDRVRGQIRELHDLVLRTVGG